MKYDWSQKFLREGNEIEYVSPTEPRQRGASLEFTRGITWAGLGAFCVGCWWLFWTYLFEPLSRHFVL